MQKLAHSLFAATVVVFAQAAAQASESLDIPVTSGGTTTTRHLNFYAPAGLKNPPMVIALHGAGGNGDNLAEGWGWDRIAEREKILVVTPSGNNAQWVIWGNDDVDFIKAIIEEMAKRYDIDRNRVYSTGFSMGGMMSYYMACHAPEVIAAIGPSAGYLHRGQSGCTGARHVPIYHIHGIWDDFVPYDTLQSYLNDNWIVPFGCPTTADESDAGTKPDSNTPGTTKREYWGPCQRDGKNSEIYLESYWKGHGYGNIETEVIWNFFKNYAMNATIPGVAIFQHGDFKGRMNRLVKGGYSHALLTAVGIPDGVVTSIRVDPGLMVEFFDNDNFQNPLATYRGDVANLSAINSKVSALRISDASGGTGGAGGTGGTSGTMTSAGGAIPGTFQAEDFDKGNEGDTYHDTDATNIGGAYRTTGVDIEPTSDAGGGYDVGWTEAGEWLSYTVNVATAGPYSLQIRVASHGEGGTFHIEFDGMNVTGTLTVPNTGDWQTYQTITASASLSVGTQVMRLVMERTGNSGFVGNFNWFGVTTESNSSDGPIGTGGTNSGGATGVLGSGGSLGSNGSRTGIAGRSSLIVDSITDDNSSNACDCTLGERGSKHWDNTIVALGLALAALVRRRRRMGG